MSGKSSSDTGFGAVLRKVLSIHKEPRPERRAIDLTLSPESARQISEIITFPNPNLGEIPFLGVGGRDIVERVYKPSDHSAKSGLLRQGVLGSSVDREQLLGLFAEASESGDLDRIILLGHLHPSGDTVIGGVRYYVTPNVDLLEPSMGYPKPTEGHSDISFFKEFKRLNPHLRSLQYAAIAAATPDGPKLKIYSIDDLIGLRRFRACLKTFDY